MISVVVFHSVSAIPAANKLSDDDQRKKKSQDRADLCDLLDLGHFEEWSDSSLYRDLRFWSEIFEALSAVRTVLEFSAIRLLDEPLSTVPTLHNWGDTQLNDSPPKAP